MRLFEFNEGIPTLSRPEIGLYKEFAIILRRDRGSRGDIGAKKKARATQEFHYIYLVADHESNLIGKGYTDNELKENAKQEANLPEEWEEDSVIRDAIKKYKDLNRDAGYELLEELLILFRGQIKETKILRKHIQNLLDVEHMDKNQIKETMDLQTRLFDIASQIPSKIKSLEKAREDIGELKDDETELMRGGEPIPESADPKRAKS